MKLNSILIGSEQPDVLAAFYGKLFGDAVYNEGGYTTWLVGEGAVTVGPHSEVHGKNQVTMQFDHPGRHGAIIAKKYWDRGESCPIAVVHGEDPALFIAGFEYLPDGRSEA